MPACFTLQKNFKNKFKKIWQHQIIILTFALTKNKKCSKCNYILNQKIGLVRKTAIQFAGHVTMLDKLKTNSL